MMDRTSACPSKDALVTYLYEEDDGLERQSIEAHFASWGAGPAPGEGFRRVRTDLAEWDAPELGARVALLPGREPAQRPRWWAIPRGVGLAAAATLVLGLSAGLANLEVRYDASGVLVRTGWSGASAAAQVGPRSEPARAPDATSPAWRAELAALERQLREELLATAADRQPGALATAGIRGRSSDAELLRRVQALVDESEVRQQRNLALRVAELARDFEFQRKTDLVQIQQGMGRLEGRTEAEVARTRELMNYIVRVSQHGGGQQNSVR
jgi:hypothetical protein